MYVYNIYIYIYKYIYLFIHVKKISKFSICDKKKSKNKYIYIYIYIKKKRITGEAVFPGNKFNEVLKKNKECIVDFNKKEIDQSSRDCKDLLIRMLEKDPIKRINVLEIQKH
jgi:hypothetical protein